MWSLFPAIIALLSAWLVYGPFPPLRRLLIGVSAAAMVYATWLFSMLTVSIFAQHGDPVDLDAVFFQINVALLLFLPGYTLAATVPVLGFRLLTGLHFWCPETPAPKYRGFSLGSLMVVMGVVAVAFGASRLGFTLVNPSEPSSSEAMISLMIGWASVAGISFLSVLPAAVCILWTKSIEVGILSLFFYAAVAMTVTIGSMSGISGQDPDAVGILFLMFLVFTVSLSLPLIYARSLGYRLMKFSTIAAATSQTEEPSPEESLFEISE